MSNQIDIRKINRTDEESLTRLDAFVQHTENTTRNLPRERDTFEVVADGETVAVFQFHVEPHLAMCFDRTAPAMRTIRVFDLIRAAMQVNGVQPLVFVEESSPLHDISGRKMTKIEGRDVYRMT